MGDIVNAMQSAVCVHRYLSTTMSSFPIRSFEQLHHHLAQLPSRCRVAVAHPADAHTLQAVLEAVQLGFVDAFLVGEVYALCWKIFPQKSPLGCTTFRFPMLELRCNRPCRWYTMEKQMF